MPITALFIRKLYIIEVSFLLVIHGKGGFLEQERYVLDHEITLKISKFIPKSTENVKPNLPNQTGQNPNFKSFHLQNVGILQA